MFANFKLKVGIALALILVLFGFLAPFLRLQSPSQVKPDQAFQTPNAQHFLGQDEEGRDILSRLVYGARISLGIGLSVVAISLLAGTLIGMAAGYFGGNVDRIFTFVADIFLAFPSILLIIALAALLPPSILNVIVILALVGWVSYARIIRGQVLVLKNLDYVQAARSLGFSHFRILFRHILPNALGPLIVNATFSLAGVIIAESTLSFLGLGVPSDLPTWGGLLDQGVAYLLMAPHLALAPGAAIMVTVLAFNFLGDGLRDWYAGMR